VSAGSSSQEVTICGARSAQPSQADGCRTHDLLPIAGSNSTPGYARGLRRGGGQMSRPPYLAITIQRHRQWALICLQGEIDVSNRDSLREVIDGLFESSPPTLVLDLSELAFADCASLSILVWAQRNLAEHGRELILFGAQPLVRRLLAVTGLDSYFRLSHSGAEEDIPPIGGPA
jgi:anti-anti-sigma factor